MRSLEQKVSRPTIIIVVCAVLVFGVLFARNVYDTAFDISLETSEALAGNF